MYELGLVWSCCLWGQLIQERPASKFSPELCFKRRKKVVHPSSSARRQQQPVPNLGATPSSSVRPRPAPPRAPSSAPAPAAPLCQIPAAMSELFHPDRQLPPRTPIVCPPATASLCSSPAQPVSLPARACVIVIISNMNYMHARYKTNAAKGNRTLHVG